MITIEKVKRAYEDVEMKNLPLNHSIVDRERIYYESTYKLNEFSEI